MTSKRETRPKRGRAGGTSMRTVHYRKKLPGGGGRWGDTVDIRLCKKSSREKGK